MPDTRTSNVVPIERARPAQRGDDLLDCTGRLVLSDCEVSRG